jgi:hypothetical protein
VDDLPVAVDAGENEDLLEGACELASLERCANGRGPDVVASDSRGSFDLGGGLCGAVRAQECHHSGHERDGAV